MASAFRIDEQTRQNYAGLFLMKHMMDEDADYLVALENDEKVLEPLFSWLFQQTYVDVTERNTYTLTAKGRNVVERIETRFQSFLEEYDIYCAVDLDAGEFAFAHYHDFEEDEDWQEFLSQERWDDLRLAMAEYINLDPIEIIFMTFVREGQFGFDEEGWNFDLLLGEIWDEIASIYASSVTLKSLGYVDGSSIIAAEDVAAEIVVQGRELMAHLSLDG